ncbi:MAG TPA: hypothetical protein VKB93_16725 [Thermoanaerobaculia bacterium]|nr:hypothetical protein [Thermoanaerobaculia bacterium]
MGRTLIPARPDDSHSNFAWSEQHGALLQECVDGRYRAGLRLCDLALLLVDANDRVTEEFCLRGKTLDDGFRFYEERVGKMLARPGEELPHHAVLDGACFNAMDDMLAKLASMYGSAAAILERIRAKHPSASPVRCWPHHFDIATLIPLPDNRSIGLGFLGGDANIPEPYWYVYAVPAPEATLPPLSVGRWYAGAWAGAVLTGEHDDVTAERFLDEAIDALK